MKQMQYDSQSDIPYWVVQTALPPTNGNVSYLQSDSIYSGPNGDVYIGSSGVIGNVKLTPTQPYYPSITSITRAGALKWANNYTWGNTTAGRIYGTGSMGFISSNVSTGALYTSSGSPTLITNSSTDGTNTWENSYNGNYGSTPTNIDQNGIDAIGVLRANVILAGTDYGDGINSAYNMWSVTQTDGSVNWVKKIEATGASFYATSNGDLVVDSSNNIHGGYNIQRYYSTAPNQHYYNVILFMKMTSSGAKTYGIEINTGTEGPTASTGPSMYGVAANSSGATFGLWQCAGQQNTAYFISKWTTAGLGTPDWTVKTSLSGLGTYSNNPILKGIYIDTSNNIYVAGSVYTSAELPVKSRNFVVKYDSSGSIVWSRTIEVNESLTTVANTTTQISSFAFNNIANAGDFVVACNTSESMTGAPYSKPYGTTAWYLPSDGSLTGTYYVTASNTISTTTNVAFDYASVTLTTSSNGYDANIAFASSGTTVDNAYFVANTAAVTYVTANSYATFGGPVTLNTTLI